MERSKKSANGDNTLTLVTNDLAVDNSNNILSSICYFKIDGDWRSGDAIFLPPATGITVEESIDVLLKIYGKHASNETFPDWTSKIKLPGMHDIELRIINLKHQQSEVERQIITELKSKLAIENHYRLLVSKDHALEDAVYEAFKILGFEEIDRKRPKSKEDWVFEFKSLPNYTHGILEVKGANTRTELKDLRQCQNWVDDYLEENLKAKGILIANQYRLEPYPSSQANRLHFEPNEINYAQQHKLCIIPSCLLFETIVKILSKGGSKRKEIEKVIASCNGVLSKLF